MAAANTVMTILLPKAHGERRRWAFASVRLTGDFAMRAGSCIALGSLVYAVAVMVALPVPRLALPSSAARWLVDIGLLLLVGLHHAVARGTPSGLGRRWTVDPQRGYAFDALATGGLVVLLFGAWQPLATHIWRAASADGRALLWAGWLAGWALTVLAVRRAPDLPASSPAIAALARELRLPDCRWSGALLLGVAMVGFCAPEMTADHLLVSAATTGWLAVRFARQRGALRHFW